MKEKQFDQIDKIKIYAEFPNQKQDQKQTLAAMFEGEAGDDLGDDTQL